MIILAFDTETTALVENHTIKMDKQPYVIEFYGVLTNLETGELINELDLLIKPPISIPEQVTKITGIDDAMVADAKQFEVYASSIKKLIEDAPTILAHNLSFDMEVLDLQFERLGQSIKWPNERICTVEQTVHINGYRLSLSNLHEKLFGVAFPGAHRAKVDVQALVRCATEMYKKGWI